jgi:phage/plasmid primase-like uncharacterized protein
MDKGGVRTVPTVPTVRAMLSYIPPDLPHADWVRVAMAVKDGLNGEGFDVFDAWSRDGHTYDAAACRDAWNSIKADGAVTFATLCGMAKDHGWKPNSEAYQETEAERQERERKRRELAEREAKKKARTQADAAKNAAKIYGLAKPAAKPGYLEMKGESPVSGLREIEAGAALKIRSFGPNIKPDAGLLLLIPMYGPDGKLCGLEAIDAKGNKGFMAGCKKGVFIIGAIEPGKPVGVVEGLATGLSVYRATGYAVAVAFDAGRLRAVAEAIRAEHSAVRLIVCGDRGNGQAKAEAAALAVDGLVAVPQFPEESTGTDWNDLAALSGVDVVRSQIAAATIQAAPIHGAADFGQSHQPRKKTDLITAADLCAKHFNPVRWIVPGLLPAGLTILAGAPKTGKSWFALDLAIAGATGGAVLGKVQVDPGDVLYLALEDNQRRLKSRLLKRLGGESAPDNLELATQWARLDQGAVDRLKEWLIGHPAARLIVIDTLARIRPPSNAKNNTYESDYAVGVELLQLAAEYNVAIVLVHHTRKGEADDPLELISGSTGLTGGVDNVMVLQRVRGTDDATLFVTGRDIENENKYGLSWDSQIAAWRVTGEGPHVGLSPERRAVFDIVAEHGPINGREVTQLLHPGVEITRESKEWKATRRLFGKLEDAGLIQNTTNGYALTARSGKPAIPEFPPDPVEPDKAGTERAVGNADSAIAQSVPPTKLVRCSNCANWRDRCVAGMEVSDSNFLRVCGVFKPPVIVQPSYT